MLSVNYSPSIRHWGREGDLRVDRRDAERAFVQLHCQARQGAAAVVTWFTG